MYKPQVDDNRISDGAERSVPIESAIASALRREIKKLTHPTANVEIRILIGGTPVYDEFSGTVKYEMSLTRSHADLKDVKARYGLDFISFNRNAEMAEQDVALALESLDMPTSFTIEKIRFGDIYYLVVAHINPHSAKDARSVREGLAELVSRMSVSETVH